MTVLSNLETHNSQMIREGRSKEERFEILKEIAIYQIKIFDEASLIENSVDVSKMIEDKDIVDDKKE